MEIRTDQELLEGLRDWIEDVNDLSGNGLLIVEGKKDMAALRNIGVTTPIAVLNIGMKLYDMIDSLVKGGPLGGTGNDGRLLIVMTDWDRKGGQLASRISKACTHLDIPHDTDLRRRLVLLTGRYIKTVESLDSLRDRLFTRER